MKLSWTRNGLQFRAASDQTSLRPGGLGSVDATASGNSASRGVGPALPKASMPDSSRFGGFTVKRAQEITTQLQPSSLISLVVVNARVFGRAGQFLKAAGSLSDASSAGSESRAKGAVHATGSNARRLRILALVEKKPHKPE